MTRFNEFTSKNQTALYLFHSKYTKVNGSSSSPLPVTGHDHKASFW